MQYRVARIEKDPNFAPARGYAYSAPIRFSEDGQAIDNSFETFDRAMQFASYLNDLMSQTGSAPFEGKTWGVYSLECLGTNPTSGELIWDVPRLA
jgi:hypothetical protein